MEGEFQVQKCGCNTYVDGNNRSRGCKNCDYLELPTVDTLFHKLKFHIEKAFNMLFLSNRKCVDLTPNELSDILELRRETCWAFKNMISLAMETGEHTKELEWLGNLGTYSLE